MTVPFQLTTHSTTGTLRLLGSTLLGMALACLPAASRAETPSATVGTWDLSGTLTLAKQLRVSNLAHVLPLKGKPAASMEIRVSDSTGRRYVAHSDAQGHFQLNHVELLRDGHETIGVTGPLMCGFELEGFTEMLKAPPGPLRLSIGVVRNKAWERNWQTKHCSQRPDQPDKPPAQKPAA